MKTVIIAVIAVVAIIGGAVIISNNKDEGSNTTGAPSQNYYGQEEGVITVVEYADFECPACGSFFPIVSQVKEEFKDQIRFEFRHFPLVQIHQNAQAAHRASQAAANQGKFWEMHDLLFQNQQTWNGQATANPAGIFEGYARQIGLDMTQYQADVNSSDVLATINADIALGKEVNVTGTPTFVIDGKKIEDTNSLASVESFSSAIQAAIDAKSGEASETTDE